MRAGNSYDWASRSLISQHVTRSLRFFTLFSCYRFAAWTVLTFLSSQPHQFAESCKFCLFYPPGKAEVHLQMIWKRVLLNFFNLYLWNSSLRSLGMFCFRVMDKTLGSSCLFMAGGALHGLKANTTWNNKSMMMIIIMVIAWWWRWSLLQTQGLSIREKNAFLLKWHQCFPVSSSQ